MRKKIKIPLGTSLQREQRKQHFINLFPFLRKEFRALKENELKSKKVFTELFPDEPIDFTKLRTIKKFQEI
jgi:ribosomal protein L19E